MSSQNISSNIHGTKFKYINDNEVDSSHYRSYSDECQPYVKASSLSPFQFMAFAAITISTIINIINAINNNNNNNDNNNNNNLVSFEKLGFVKMSFTNFYL